VGGGFSKTNPGGLWGGFCWGFFCFCGFCVWVGGLKLGWFLGVFGFGVFFGCGGVFSPQGVGGRGVFWGFWFWGFGFGLGVGGFFVGCLGWGVSSQLVVGVGWWGGGGGVFFLLLVGLGDLTFPTTNKNPGKPGQGGGDQRLANWNEKEAERGEKSTTIVGGGGRVLKGREEKFQKKENMTLERRTSHSRGGGLSWRVKWVS